VFVRDAINSRIGSVITYDIPVHTQIAEVPQAREKRAISSCFFLETPDTSGGRFEVWSFWTHVSPVSVVTLSRRHFTYGIYHEHSPPEMDGLSTFM
jgi:hypothetical protein